MSSNETTIVDAFFEGLRILILGKENTSSNLQNRSLERLKKCILISVVNKLQPSEKRDRFNTSYCHLSLKRKSHLEVMSEMRFFNTNPSSSYK